MTIAELEELQRRKEAGEQLAPEEEEALRQTSESLAEALKPALAHVAALESALRPYQERIRHYSEAVSQIVEVAESAIRHSFLGIGGKWPEADIQEGETPARVGWESYEYFASLLNERGWEVWPALENLARFMEARAEEATSDWDALKQIEASSAELREKDKALRGRILIARLILHSRLGGLRRAMNSFVLNLNVPAPTAEEEASLEPPAASLDTSRRDGSAARLRPCLAAAIARNPLLAWRRAPQSTWALLAEAWENECRRGEETRKYLESLPPKDRPTGLSETSLRNHVQHAISDYPDILSKSQA